jgi:hypothetical protein
LLLVFNFIQTAQLRSVFPYFFNGSVSWSGQPRGVHSAAIPSILPQVRDLLFDHVPQRGSGKGYDHHDYKPEMRAAMEIWAEYIHMV